MYMYEIDHVHVPVHVHVDVYTCTCMCTSTCTCMHMYVYMYTVYNVNVRVPAYFLQQRGDASSTVLQVKRHILQVSTHQMAVLLLFNKKTNITFQVTCVA